MLGDAAWVVLHGGHNDGAAATFETAFGGLVALLVVAGALWYFGVFEAVASAEAAGAGSRTDDAAPPDDPASESGTSD